ncbi:MAG: hypothetical protein HY332_09930 [Chloroflexi bacterium]|nr:hypothetical protein [Chloroflexota bacterium]
MAIGLVMHERIAALADVAARLDAKGLADESRRVRAVLAQLEQAPRAPPATAAAEILAVTPQTVRNWIRSGLLPGRRDGTGHCYVPVDALEPAIRLREVLPDQPAGTITDEELDAEIEAVRRDWNRSQYPDDYADVPGYLKDTGFIVMLPVDPPPNPDGTPGQRPYLWIPRPQEVNFLVTVQSAALDTALGTDQRGWADVLNSVLSQTSPAGVDVGGWSRLLPPAVRTGVELGANYDFFRGREIVPGRRQQLPVAEQVRPETSALGRAVEGFASYLGDLLSEHGKAQGANATAKGGNERGADTRARAQDDEDDDIQQVTPDDIAGTSIERFVKIQDKLMSALGKGEEPTASVKVAKKPAADKAEGTKRFTPQDIEKMSTSEFAANYDRLARQMDAIAPPERSLRNLRPDTTPLQEALGGPGEDK